MNKQELRQLIRQRKAACPQTERAALSAAVCRLAGANPHISEANTILLYHPLPDEVDIRPLIHSLSASCRILLPVVVGDDLELRLYRDDKDLREGAFHILEPMGEAFNQYDEIDTAVIPGMAFTINGDRLGRGKGYYDRLLSRLSNTYFIGVCWPFQIVDDIPHEKHDIRMEEVLAAGI
ncbi:MAG: 5-formyltetrahydrofolate cyclo-ligase [Bacteroidaceae bacterium]|nr:5-formyltetrahydrofolate cyclo-ligase [Bacteroidaceae bacterium]